MIKIFAPFPEAMGLYYKEESRTDDAVEYFNTMKEAIEKNENPESITLRLEGCLVALSEAINDKEPSAHAIYRAMKQDLVIAHSFLQNTEEYLAIKDLMLKIDTTMHAQINLAVSIYENSRAPIEALTEEEMQNLDRAYYLDSIESDLSEPMEVEKP